MSTVTENNETGFTIFRRSRRSTNNRGTGNRGTGNRRQGNYRRNERMHLLHSVASGDLEPEVAVNLLNRTYSQPPTRFHHSVTRSGKVLINGLLMGQSIALFVDEWQKIAAYLGGNNFKNFVEHNADKLKTKRPPRKPHTEHDGVAVDGVVTDGVAVDDVAVDDVAVDDVVTDDVAVDDVVTDDVAVDGIVTDDVVTDDVVTDDVVTDDVVTDDVVTNT